MTLTIFEQGAPGRRAFVAPDFDVPEAPDALPEQFRRTEPPRLPEVSEPELVRHYVRLSKKNFDLDSGFYPLGSCTMKHNPRLHERVAGLDGHARLHPLQDPAQAQGALELMWNLERSLAEISGLPHVSLQPSAAQRSITLSTGTLRRSANSRTTGCSCSASTPSSATSCLRA